MSQPPSLAKVSARFPSARRILALALGAGLAIGVAGCSPVDPDEATPKTWVEPPTINESASILFSAEQIDLAYSTVTAFALDRGFDAELTNPEVTSYTVEELVVPIVPHVAPALQERWRGYAEAAVGASAAGNPDAAQAAKDDMRPLQFFDWEQPTWTLPADGTALQWQWLGNAQIDGEPAVVPAPVETPPLEEEPVEEGPVEEEPVEEEPVEEESTDGSVAMVDTATVSDTVAVPARLKITVDHEVEFVFVEDGGEFELRTAKRVTYWLVLNAAGDGWLIDAYEGTFNAASELPTDPGGNQDIPSSTTNPFNTGIPADDDDTTASAATTAPYDRPGASAPGATVT